MGKIQAGLEIQAGVQGLDEIKKLSAEIEAAGTDTGRLAEQSRELETAFARVSAQNALIAQYRQLKDELGYTKTALKAARDGLAELDRQMQSGATREQNAAYRDLQRTVRRLEAEQSNLQGRLKLAAADMRDAGISAKDLAAAERRIAEETGQAAAKLEKLTAEAQKMKRVAEAKTVLGIKTDQARAELAKVKQSYAELKASGTQTKRELKQATAAYTARVRELKAELKGVPSKLNPIAASVRGMGGAMLGVAGVGGGLYAVKEGLQQVVQATAEYAAIRSRMEYAFGGTEAAGAQMQWVKGLAEELGLEVRTLAAGYAQLASATKNIGFTTEQTQQVFKGVAAAAAKMNLSTDETNGVLLALSAWARYATARQAWVSPSRPPSASSNWPCRLWPKGWPPSHSATCRPTSSRRRKKCWPPRTSISARRKKKPSPSKARRQRPWRTRRKPRRNASRGLRPKPAPPIRPPHRPPSMPPPGPYRHSRRHRPPSARRRRPPPPKPHRKRKRHRPPPSARRKKPKKRGLKPSRKQAAVRRSWPKSNSRCAMPASWRTKPSAPESAVYGLDGATYPNDTLYLPHGVLPGSVKIDGYRDNGLGRLSGSGGASLSVDYERGMIQGVRGIYGLNITAVPAAKVSNARHTAYIDIKDGNQGAAWAPLLQPAPAPGSLTVSYMSLGVWYGLSDAGDYILRTEDGTAAGTVSDTGSAVLTLPALPDVGSRIVLQWGDASNYRTFDAQASGKTPVVRQVSGSALVPSAPAGYIKPGSLRLSWNGKTAQDDKGRLKGQAQGRVDYMRGSAVVTGGLEAAPVTVSYQAYTGKEVAAAINDTGAAALDTRIGKTAPGSLQLALLYRASAAASTARWVKAEYNNLSVGGNILAREKHDVKILADSAKYQGQTLIRLTDDGNGGLLLPDGTKLNGASIDYADGHIVIPDAKTAGIPIRITLKTGETATVAPGASVTDYDGSTTYLLTERTVTGVSVYIEQAAASRIADTAVRTVSVTETPSNLSASIYNGTQGGAPVFNTWAFEIGGVKIIERNGTLYRNWDYAKGTGEAVGRLTDGGEITFTAENLDFAALKITAGILAKNTERVYAYAGRTEAAPVKPESFTVYAVANGQTVSGRADADGHITGGITGSIHYETGFYQIAASDGLIAETLRYNAVTQDHIPLDSSIIGIDSVRLPADGRVPVFRKGDMIVIGNRFKQDLGQTFTGGQTVALARQNLDRACLLDAQGRHVSAEKYSIDLAAGKLTFAEPLSLAGHTLPLTAVLAWEEENRITAADVSGRLKLQTPLTRDYPQEGTYVSSALVGGDLLVRAT